MADAILTQARLKELLHYDPETGIFTWAISRPGMPKGRIAGSLHNEGYIDLMIDGRHYRAHRLAWLYVYGKFPDDLIDHKDGVRSNNKISNLRECTNSTNLQNLKRGYTGTSSSFLGVSWHRKANKWVAQIVTNGKNKYLGLFNTEEDAHKAYLAAKATLHPYGEIAKK
jgi:hypothetical protein